MRGDLVSDSQISSRPTAPTGRAEAHRPPPRINGGDLAPSVEPRLGLRSCGVVGPPHPLRRGRWQHADERVDLVERHLERAVGGMAQVPEQRVVFRHWVTLRAITLVTALVSNAITLHGRPSRATVTDDRYKKRACSSAVWHTWLPPSVVLALPVAADGFLPVRLIATAAHDQHPSHMSA